LYQLRKLTDTSNYTSTVWYVTVSTCSDSFFFKSYAAHRDLHSFPTRRSSDLKIGAILAVVVLGFVLAGKRPPSAQPLFPSSFQMSLLTGLLTAMVGALWAYDGWMDLTFAGSEIINPQKNIPRALVGGTMTVGVIYLLANAVYFRVLPMEAVAAAQNVASETVRVFDGPRAAAWITAA